MSIQGIIMAQCALIMIAMFEPPGPLEDGRFKSISDGLREHPGVAMAIFVTEIAAVHVTMKTTLYKPTAYLFAWSSLAGFTGMMFYPNNVIHVHLAFACVALASPTLLLTQLALESLDNHRNVMCVLWAALVAVGFSFAAWRKATGILELTYLCALWLAWVHVVNEI